MKKRTRELTARQQRVINSGSWGSLFGFLYFACMSAWKSALVMILVNFIAAIPFVGWILAILIGIYYIIHAKRIAWKTRKWDDFEHFEEVQKAWDKVAKIVYSIVLVIILLIFLDSMRWGLLS